MSVIWSKVWADLWGNKVRTILVVLSISAGVFAVGAMFGMGDQLLSGMDRAHQAVFPSHLSMWLTERVDRNIVTGLKRIKGVEDIEVYNQITVRYKIHPEDEWKTGLLEMRDGYDSLKYDILQLKEGHWPQNEEIGIERLSSQYFGLDIGDRVIFDLETTDRALPITGKIRHPFVPPPQFGGQAVFFVDEQGLERFGVPAGRFASLRARVRPYSADFAKEVATEVKSRLAREGVGVAATVYQDPKEHWGRMFVEGITLVLQVLAVISLITSVILVLNTLTALITQQTDQIGIIKAIGGTSGTVIKIYLAAVLVYGLLALFVSLPLGAFLAYALSRWFLNLFNIDYDVFQVSQQAVILQVLAAIAVPVLAALWPVLSGAAITVREAIASYGLGGDFGSNWLDRAVERLSQRLLPSHYAVALANLFRRKGRLILTQLVLITSGIMFLMVMTLSSSITLTLDQDSARRRYDAEINFTDNQRVDRAVELAESIQGVEYAEVIYTHPATILKEGQRATSAGLGGSLIGMPVDSDVYIPFVVAGRWLRPGDGRVVVISKDTADDNGIQLGDNITLDLGELGKDDWQVIGFYQIIFGGGFSSDSVFAPRDAVFTATKKHNEGGLMYVRTRRHTAEFADPVMAQLRDLFDRRNMDVFFIQTVYEFRKSADQQFGVFINMLLALAIIVAAVGGIGLMGSLSISVVERTKEIGVMRAVGARSGTIMGMFMMEGILQGLLSWGIAVPLSYLVSQPVARALGQALFSANLDYQYNWSAVLVWLVIIVVISAAASVIPARNATLISVRDSLAYA